MNSLKKNIQKLFFFWTIPLYFLSRLINLKIIPIFTDEAIYSYWAQVALNDPENRYISLVDGKQPLFIWLGAIAQKIIPDPLIAIRIVSVVSGFGTFIAIYLIARQLFSKEVAMVAAVLYLLLPFPLLYDRMGLYDSLLTMLGTFSVYFAIKLIKTPNLGLGFLNGFAIGLAMITKSSGFFYLYLLPFSLFTANKSFKLFKWVAFTSVSAILSFIIYNSLRLSPLFYLINRKNQEFIRPINEVLKDPLAHFYSNFNAISGWIITYLSPPLFLIFILSIVIAIYRKNLKAIYLIILILAPFSAELLFNKVLYARFTLFYFPYIIILTSVLVISILKKITNINLRIATCIMLLFLPLNTSFKLLTNPATAPIPKNDSDQYLNDWPAGYGVSETIDILNSKSDGKEIYVATEGTFGLMPFSLNIYFYKNQNVHISAFWPLDPENLPQQVVENSKKYESYLILNANQKEILNPRLKPIASFKKGIGNSYLRLYEIEIK